MICGSTSFEPTWQMTDFPAFMGVADLNSPVEDDLVATLDISSCEYCFCPQLRWLVDPEILYHQSHGAGSTGGIWARHHEVFADFVLNEELGRSVLEIGGGHGILSARVVPQREIAWTVVEPNPSDNYRDDVNVVEGFFDSRLEIRDLDCLVHSHFFEHVFDPVGFLELCTRALVPGGRMLFSVPNMQVMLDKGFLNMLNFEHTYLLTEKICDALLADNGFEVVRKFFFEEHSIFWSCKKIDVSPGRLEAADLSLGNEFDKYVAQANSYFAGVKRIVDAFDGDVYIFGGHVFSQFVLFGSQIQSRVSGILDNDPGKWGRRLYGTNLLISDPQILQGRRGCMVITSNTGIYRSEIESQIKEICEEPVFA